jgi:SpoVK/Ycf46/Vps4 family AAA+-type ATPase
VIRPDALDPALRRAGRFDREIALGVPDENARYPKQKHKFKATVNILDTIHNLDTVHSCEGQIS